MDKTSVIYKLAKVLFHWLRYLQSLPFRLRYRKTFVFGKDCIIKKCKVHNAKGAKILIGNNVKLDHVLFHFESTGNKVEIGDNVSLFHVEIIGRSVGNNLIKIGKKTTTGSCQFDASEGSSIIVGEDCMFSHNIKVWATAHHSILNYEGKRINPAKSIKIGNHCWIGHSSMILKGANVPDGSIVGAASLYTGKFTDTNSVYAGCPAKKLKDNISWTRDLKTIPSDH